AEQQQQELRWLHEHLNVRSLFSPGLTVASKRRSELFLKTIFSELAVAYNLACEENDDNGDDIEKENQSALQEHHVYDTHYWQPGRGGNMGRNGSRMLTSHPAESEQKSARILCAITQFVNFCDRELNRLRAVACNDDYVTPDWSAMQSYWRCYEFVQHDCGGLFLDCFGNLDLFSFLRTMP
ncbi:unnamed protein product, partial [Amoebophrya sp. A120]